LWYKDNGTTTAWANIMHKLNSETAGWILQRENATSAASLRIDTSAADYQGPVTLPGVLDGGWHHIVIVIDSGNAYGYLDGELVDSGAYSHGTGFGQSAIGLHLGFDLNGTYDDIRIYDRVLTESD